MKINVLHSTHLTKMLWAGATVLVILCITTLVYVFWSNTDTNTSEASAGPKTSDLEYFSDVQVGEITVTESDGKIFNTSDDLIGPGSGFGSFAFEMSRESLLGVTNEARAVNGLAALSISTRLNDAAQAKAQDMADADYWSHVSPNGTQPWYFFEQAGYDYTLAGENLAYGFKTDRGVIDGWMSSQSHRTNMLGDYFEVGFGIVNDYDYLDSGNQTIVVAHYGKR